jgi:hypothetical protein
LRNARRDHPSSETGEVLSVCLCPVIDHILPLKRGGPDTPANMEWQTADAKAKDRWE